MTFSQIFVLFIIGYLGLFGIVDRICRAVEISRVGKTLEHLSENAPGNDKIVENLDEKSVKND